ncbi:MAG TPA: c-type cytochrome [Rhizomicrobium sp.]|jgi:mono/diheme cytochrome c family protein|nr:c-type cytochrome [Rhizomicrobium sp.]
MHSVTRAAIVASALAFLGAVAVPLYVDLASEAVIERRYPLPVIEEPLAADSIKRGAHLAMIAGCSDCHGANFEGRRESVGPLRLWSSNLRLAAGEMSAGEFERALRRGLAPDATGLWAMPSEDYMYMSEADVADLYAYLRAFGKAGRLTPGPVWNLRARFALLRGRLVPAVIAARDTVSSLDLGPRYDGGRYLARIACSECHGGDLAGSGAVPDLIGIARYNRQALFDLLRRGWGAQGRRAPAMYRLARVRFHAFADYEIMALFDYLSARAHAPAAMFARAKVNEQRRRELIMLENDD